MRRRILPCNPHPFRLTFARRWEWSQRERPFVTSVVPGGVWFPARAGCAGKGAAQTAALKDSLETRGCFAPAVYFC